ncbi:MAG: helix-turn-helix domain-containing protein [Coleofasciculus sp. C1-SOL-03]
MLNLNYTYRIYPDAEQVESLNEWLETCRGHPTPYTLHPTPYTQ